VTDHELAVKMVRQGIEVFREVNKDTVVSTEMLPMTATLLPVLLATCISTVAHVHLMKQIAAAISNKEVKLP
jgi:hypothetical protein